MRFLTRTNAHLALNAVLLFGSLPSVIAVASNTVVREIFSDRGSLVVEDRLNVHEHYAIRDPCVRDVFYGARDSATNLLERICKVYAGESLQVEQYRPRISGEVMDLWVRSKVVFKDKQEPARLRWEPFLEGQNISFPKGSIGRTGSGLDILIFENGGAPVLWFPDLGPADHASLAAIDQGRKTLEFLYDRADIEFRLHLQTENGLQELFFWCPGAKPREKPDTASIIRMSQFHQISQNDLRDLIGEMRIGKSGYYIMRAGEVSSPAESRRGGMEGHREVPDSGITSISPEQGSPKFTIDGSFDARKGYKLAWPETGGVGPGGAGDGIDIKECYYFNDSSYLYLFLRCKPTIQERYEKVRASGMLAWLYIDSDSNPATGASQKDDAGNAAMLGADIQICVPIGIYATLGPTGERKGCNVVYNISNWDASSKDFSVRVRDEDSKEPGSLIAHGKDGVEMALPLSALGKRKGDKFDLICVEAANNRPELANRITIRLQ